MVGFWTGGTFFSVLLGQSSEQCPFCPHVQQSTSIGSFLSLAEDDPDEALNASRIVTAVFPVGGGCRLRLRVRRVFLLFGQDTYRSTRRVYG
jgi:hypothetical protein